MIQDATFTSVWDGGFEITTKCKVNINTREVFDIELSGIDIDDGILIREFVTIDNKEYLCGSSTSDTEDWNPETDYWYQ